MATSYTYTSLKAAIVSFTEDQGTEFASALDTIIPLAEDKALKDLDLELFDDSASNTFTVSSPWLAKPSGMLAVRSMHYTTATGDFKILEPRTWEFCKDYWPKDSTTTSTPKYYAEYSESDWFIAGTPASGLVVTARYISRPLGLSAITATTWLSTNVGDLLFYACLACSEQFLKADNRIAMWKQDYADRLVTTLGELKPETRHNYMPVTAIPTKE